jgi:hypothetical protein
LLCAGKQQVEKNLVTYNAFLGACRWDVNSAPKDWGFSYQHGEVYPPVNRENVFGACTNIVLSFSNIILVRPYQTHIYPPVNHWTWRLYQYFQRSSSPWLSTKVRMPGSGRGGTGGFLSRWFQLVAKGYFA